MLRSLKLILLMDYVGQEFRQGSIDGSLETQLGSFKWESDSDSLGWNHLDIASLMSNGFARMTRWLGSAETVNHSTYPWLFFVTWACHIVVPGFFTDSKCSMLYGLFWSWFRSYAMLLLSASLDQLQINCQGQAGFNEREITFHFLMQEWQDHNI